MPIAGTRPLPCRPPRSSWPSSEGRPLLDSHPLGRGRWNALLESPGPILADGAMGTMLFQAGLEFGDPPESWNVLHPDRVRLVHRGYLEAGSRLILTNTFGGNRFRLGMHGQQSRVGELNR